MERIQGLVEHIVYHNEENGYTVFSIMHQGKETVCVGSVSTLDEGEYLVLEGEFTLHPVYGRQFKAERMAIEVPEDIYSIERYLGSGAIKGVGSALAARMVKCFGADTFRIIEEEPERLSEVKGISDRKAREIYLQFHEKQDMRQAMMFLANYGISPTLSLRIYKAYGNDLYTIIRENPYRLAEDMSGIGFRLADEIARHAGIDLHSEFRIRSGVLYMLQQAGAGGHLYLPEDMLCRESAALLGVDEAEVTLQLQELQMDRRIVIRPAGDIRAVYLKAAYYTELETATMLGRLNIRYQLDQPEADRMLKRIEKDEQLILDEHQKDAVVSSAEHGVFVLTGGPGTGKTTTINAMIKFYEYQGMDILLAAPTGRAAKRMSETTGCEARTIHRMLELNGRPDDEDGHITPKFERNEENPLETDVVIIDEMSMVDIYLMHALLKAIPEGTRLIMVGDVNQLPSVGPGNVLKDILSTGIFASANLTTIFRQALESDIVRNAHMINEGRQVALDNKSKDFFCLKRYSAADILGVMILLIRDKLPSYVKASPYEIQVLTPMRKGELGVEHLNKVLQQYLNPAAQDKKEKSFHSGILRVGDKVMQIKNNYQMEWEVTGNFNLVQEKGVGIFNGDMGIVRDINHFSEQVTVEFDEQRQVLYSFSQLDELELAYAVTIHKSQGSEYPAVILPLLAGPRMLFNRNLLYTAVTRARKCVAIIGDEQTVAEMIRNEREQRRFTSLDERILEVAG